MTGTEMSGSVVEQASSVVGKPAATVLLSTDADEKPFLAEALLIGATVFLLERYAESFLTGLGFDEMAERHGQRARGLLSKLRTGKIDDSEVALAAEQAEAAVAEVRSHRGHEAAHRDAEQAIVRELTDSGSIRVAAEDIARDLSAVVLTP